MATQRVLMMVCCWERLTELCLDDRKVTDLEQLTEIPKEMSLACLMVERMVMRMVQMTEIGWVQL